MPAMTDTSRRTALVALGGGALALALGGCTAAATGDPNANTVKAADVPVGGGKIVGKWVVTQPEAGSFAAFSYLCTHQNLPVQQVSDRGIICGRHGSMFSLTDGSVLLGPATTGLAKATVTVDGDTLRLS